MRSLFFLLLCLCDPALACPRIDGVPDHNCDGKVEIVVMGDSLAYGFGDTQNRNKGGYVLRAARTLRNVTFINFAKRGAFTKDVLSILSNAFTKHTLPEVESALANADYVIIDVGRNDRWLFKPVIASYRNVKRAVSMIERGAIDLEKIPPVIIPAVLMLPNRGAQAPWVVEFNGYVRLGNRRSHIPDLRFDLVSKYLLSEDQIHPTSKGYAALSRVFVNFLKKLKS